MDGLEMIADWRKAGMGRRAFICISDDGALYRCDLYDPWISGRGSGDVLAEAVRDAIEEADRQSAMYGNDYQRTHKEQ